MRRLAATCAWLAILLEATAVEVPPPVRTGGDGKLVYEVDSHGHRILDFSFAGYDGGGVPLPHVPARVRVAPVDGDDTAHIQSAIDHVSSLPPEDDGFRGAVLLEKGRFKIAGQLVLSTSGIVLRGSDGTVLVATGTGRRTLIEAAGTPESVIQGKALHVTDSHVPTGVPVLHLDDTEDLKPGARVRIVRPSTPAWIEFIGMDRSPGRTPYHWKPGTLDLQWDRIVTAIEGNRVTLDIPLTTDIESRFGGATLVRIDRPGRLRQVGIENLRCESEFDPTRPRDEEHSWMAVALDEVEDAWVRRVTAAHFVSSAVHLGDGCRQVTVQDCISESPVSEIAGHRREAFVTLGQLTLFHRCTANEAIHAFSAGPLATGPNVFLDCESRNDLGFSGPTGSWTSGLLFDQVAIDGGELRFDQLETWNQGTGWNAAHSVAWQCQASRLVCRTPPGAPNHAIGGWGQFVGDGNWSALSEFVKPLSLYQAQLADRLGTPAIATPATPDLDAGAVSWKAPAPPAEDTPAPPLALRNGWLTVDGHLLTGHQLETAWWRGHLLPSRAAETGPAITRFVPGRTGPGLTDDLDRLTDDMIAAGQVAFRHHHGLWYDRRSDDHERVRRPDADVWAPFFEQPWARGGRPADGEAWDRLTRWDLTRYNPWYFSRLREFAGLARRKGLVLIDAMYFQHNLLEAGAHWATYPWRTVNNVNATAFPEPPPYRHGDGRPPSVPGRAKRIFMADAFYDASHPVRRGLHRAYIRHCLENQTGQGNVIHTLGDEFTGPPAFMRFWLDTVIGWQAETGHDPLIALSAPKDVQDAMLDDPATCAAIDIIDFKYWWRAGQDLHAPPGGRGLAPRQSERAWKGGRPSDEDLARMAADYRRRFPEKAVICAFPEGGWAWVAAGGSLPKLPTSTDPALLRAIPAMQPAAVDGEDAWAIVGPEAGMLIYFASSSSRLALDLSALEGALVVREINRLDGSVGPPLHEITAGRRSEIPLPHPGKCVLWLRRETTPTPDP